MATAIPSIPIHPGSRPPEFRPDVLVADRIAIPGWVNDLESFRSWIKAEPMPQAGWVSYFDGVIYVDPDMEELFTHNQVKGAFAVAIANSLGTPPSGMYVFDRMLLTHPAAGLATEPDGLYFHWRTALAKRLRLVEGADGTIELEGSPDMALEVVGRNSVAKDTKKLHELYWKAEIAEYWLVDARGVEPRFDIFRREPDGYAAVLAQGGWLRSDVFDRQFQIVKASNPLGHSHFAVLSRAT